LDFASMMALPLIVRRERDLDGLADELGQLDRDVRQAAVLGRASNCATRVASYLSLRRKPAIRRR
jgi:hypothetical protein